MAIERRATVMLSASEPGTPAEGNPGSPLVAAACGHAAVTDVTVTIASNFPVGAGLGGSSAAGVALAAALACWKGEHRTPAELAEWSRVVETGGLRVAGGYQDHYAAAFGGALALHFGSAVEVRRLVLSSETVAALEARVLLLYTGESRISGDTITAVLDAYARRDPLVVTALLRMKVLALEMAEALEHGDLEALGDLVGQHWEHQRSLHPRITTDRIDAIATHARRAGAIGLKALGASGGGCVMVVVPHGGAARVAAAIAPFGTPIEWKMAHTGVQVEELPLSQSRAKG